VLLIYGGHPACLELMRRVRMKPVAVVFHLHNFGYNDRRAFADAAMLADKKPKTGSDLAKPPRAGHSAGDATRAHPGPGETDGDSDRDGVLGLSCPLPRRHELAGWKAV
jgi:hypothetical protein